jgi:hypothetical protein
MPTEAEAELLCAVRREVADLLGIEIQCTEPAKLVARYADLMAQKAAKEAASAKKAARSAVGAGEGGAGKAARKRTPKTATKGAA